MIPEHNERAVSGKAVCVCVFNVLPVVLESNTTELPSPHTPPDTIHRDQQFITTAAGAKQSSGGSIMIISHCEEASYPLRLVAVWCAPTFSLCLSVFIIVSKFIDVLRLSVTKKYPLYVG